MARGMVAGEAIVSQANTKAYEDGYERTFGNRKAQRGRWVWDAEASKLVSAEDYVSPSRAVDAPIIADRIHENTQSPIDGSDIGSRRRRREHMRTHGVEDASDAPPAWRESQVNAREREFGRTTRNAMEKAARKLYSEGKWR